VRICLLCKAEGLRQNRPKAMRENPSPAGPDGRGWFRTEEILRLTGYSYNRLCNSATIRLLRTSRGPYKDKVDEAYVRGVDEFWETSTSNMLRAERRSRTGSTKTNDGKEKISLKDLMALTSTGPIALAIQKDRQQERDLDFAK